MMLFNLFNSVYNFFFCFLDFLVKCVCVCEYVCACFMFVCVFVIERDRYINIKMNMEISIFYNFFQYQGIIIVLKDFNEFLNVFVV